MKEFKLESLSPINFSEKAETDSSPEGLYVEGYLTVPIVDRDNEIIPLDSIKYEEFLDNPILLYMHDRNKPIGRFEIIEKRSDGLWGRAFISSVAEKLYGVISLIKDKVLSTFSIGFRINDYEITKDGLVIYKSIELRECSIVSIPANPKAVFSTIKSVEEELKKEWEEKKISILENIENEQTQPNQTNPKTIKESFDMTELEKLLKEKEELEKALKAKEEAEKAAKEAMEKAKAEAEKKELLATIEKLTKEVVALKEELDATKSEVETVKTAKPKIEVVATSEKAIEENIDKYKDVAVEAMIFKKDPTSTASFKHLPEGLKSVSFDSAFTTRVNNRILEDIKVQAPLFGLFEKAGSDAKTDVYPFQGGPITASWGSLTKTNYNFTSKISFDYKKVMAGVEYAYENEEEAIISWLPYLRMQLTDAIADGIENTIINGDGTNNTFVGLIKYADDANFEYEISGADNTLTVAHLLATRAKMGKYGVDPKKVVYVVNSLKYHQLLKDANVLTVDKVGAMATIINGSLGLVAGSNILVTDLFPGVDEAGAGKYSALAVRTDMFMAKAKNLLVEIDKNIESQNKIIVASMNVSFIPKLPLTAGKITSPICALTVNGI